MSHPTTAYIGLGSNQGDGPALIDAALQRLRAFPDVSVGAVSTFRTYPALGDDKQTDYLNGAAEVKTDATATKLLQRLHAVESDLGRERGKRWAPRTIDLDLLLFGDVVIEDPTLTVPHPQMAWRSFVLAPLAEIAGDTVHPLLDVDIRTLAARLNGGSFSVSAEEPKLVSIAGNIGVGKTTAADRLAALLGATVLHEPYDSNPFLAKVYAGEQSLALDSDLYFLANRLDQLRPQALVADAITLADYVFDKGQIYARRLLDADQLALYERLYPALAEQVVCPKLVIYLEDTVEACLQRIQHRDRPYEQSITVDFLKDLHADYEALFQDWQQCPVIRLPISDFNSFDDRDSARLARWVTHYLCGAAQPADVTP